MINPRSKKVLLFLFICLHIFISTSALATTYYVDATNGLDNNAGTSVTTAWKAIAKVNASSFKPGDQILFKRGETWREMLTIPSAGSASSVIMFGVYGTGANPIITGSNLITAGWAKDSTNIWKTTITTQPNIVYINGTRGTPVTVKANITSEFNWFWASNVLYVWSPGNGDPSLFYMNPGIEAGALNRVIQTNNQSYVTFDSLTIRDGNALGDNVVNVGSSSVIGIVFQNCTIERGVADGIDFKGSTTATSVTINNCTIQNNGNWGVWVDDAYTSGTISNNAIHGNGWNSITNNNEYSGIEGNNLSNFHIYGNTIYDQAPKGCKTGGSLGDFCHGIYVPASTVATNIYNNIIRDNAYGDGVKLRGSANVYKNKIYNNAGSGIECGGNGTANVIYSIYQNLIFENNTNNQGDGIVEQLIGTGTISLIVENNTVYQNGNISQQEFNVADNVTILTVKNNLFYATPTRKTMASLAQTGTVSIDYNLHWRADGDPNLFYAGVGKTWAQWQALGYDTHGFNANPLFVNASGNNFQLQSTSPAIKAGTNVGLTTDFLGKPIIGLPDLGVYEWDPLLSPPLNLQIVPN